jgi:hypothetical protein
MLKELVINPFYFKNDFLLSQDFNYFCYVKFSKKNILFNIMFLIGTMWCYDVYFQQVHLFSKTELNSESNSAPNYIDIDSEIQDVEQIIYVLSFYALLEKSKAESHFHVSNRLVEPNFPVWQPPKLI